MTFDDIVIGLIAVAAGYSLVSWLITKIQGKSGKQGLPDIHDPRLLSDQSATSIETIDSNWYRILAVSPIATVAEIKAAYKAAIEKYHPDKVSALGPEFSEIAEKKRKEIEAAYQYAVSKYGPHFFK